MSTKRFDLPQVTTGPAFVWTCLDCGADNFGKMVQVEDPDTIRDMTARVLKEQGRDALEPDEGLEVPFRVVDGNLGIIEVLGDSLPGWLAESWVPDPKGSWFIPMPVKMAFGTWNRLDPEQQSGAVKLNRYLQASLDAVRGMFPDLTHLFALFMCHPTTVKCAKCEREFATEIGDHLGEMPESWA